jgi:hypothetical protein
MTDATEGDDVAGGSIASAERAMRRGRGRMIAAMVVAAAAAIGALAFAMRDDDHESYRAFGRYANGLEAAHFDGFVGCALDGEARFRDDEALRSAFHRRASDGGAGYGTHLRTACLAELTALAEGLAELIPPAALEGELDRERDSVRELASGTSDYAARLEASDPPGAYDEAAAEVALDRMVRAWFSFRSAHAAINAFLRDALASR